MHKIHQALLNCFELLEYLKYVFTKKTLTYKQSYLKIKKIKLHLNKFMMVRVEDHMCLSQLHSKNM